MMEAAGIRCTIEMNSEALPPAIDAVLAWTVREGVTNVIRHSRARRCTIQVSGRNGSACIEVINDGYQEWEHNSTSTKGGSGLSGLAERVVAQGGQIEASPLLAEHDSIFRLWVGVRFGTARQLKAVATMIGCYG
jgi:two-component system sensor histidine kinase DesK